MAQPVFNGFIIERDFHDDHDEPIVTATTDPERAQLVYQTMVHEVVEVSPTFTVRLYACEFLDTKNLETETMFIAETLNFQTNKVRMLGCFMQKDDYIIADINTVRGHLVELPEGGKL